MKNRRQFLQASLAVSAASLTMPRALAAEPAAVKLAALPPELFIYDERFAQSIRAARDAVALNVPVASIARVMTELWYDELDLRWKQQAMTLGGMTTEHGLFVFETLALDRGMRVIDRAASGSGDLIAWTIGPRVKEE